eukprot:TRINITY_DN11746_c0_g1_i1.p2 TRINITY_DN11746_c0_g1~~TRINITY_DN11746_c0_g1_i1.p2  ORF type:complete len:127 (+),score=16.10 TRINITY_DN11746_c0_g1_i1:60-383(+)
MCIRDRMTQSSQREISLLTQIKVTDSGSIFKIHVKQAQFLSNPTIKAMHTDFSTKEGAKTKLEDPPVQCFTVSQRTDDRSRSQLDYLKPLSPTAIKSGFSITLMILR